jgi:diguanylate cyclase (GGDEF)-like protein
MRELVMPRGVLARVGGDEFAAILPGADAESATRTAHAIRAAVEAFEFEWADRQFRVGASVGVLPFRSGVERINTLIEAVDSACYRAKRAGRNTVELATVAPL